MNDDITHKWLFCFSFFAITTDPINSNKLLINLWFGKIIVGLKLSDAIGRGAALIITFAGLHSVFKFFIFNVDTKLTIIWPFLNLQIFNSLVATFGNKPTKIIDDLSMISWFSE